MGSRAQVAELLHATCPFVMVFLSHGFPRAFQTASLSYMLASQWASGRYAFGPVSGLGSPHKCTWHSRHCRGSFTFIFTKPA